MVYLSGSGNGGGSYGGSGVASELEVVCIPNHWTMNGNKVKYDKFNINQWDSNGPAAFGAVSIKYILPI